MTHAPLHSYIETDHSTVPIIACLRFYREHRALMIWTVLVLFIIFLINLLLSPFLVRQTQMHFRFILPIPEAGASDAWVLLWEIMKSLYITMIKSGSFFLSFLIAYVLASPFYQYMSGLTEDLFRGHGVKEDAVPDIEEIVEDLKRAVFIVPLLFGVTIVALIANFIPFFGSLLCFALLCFCSALLFLDFPASRRGWDLRQKIDWLIANPWEILRFGLFPSLIVLIPILTSFIMGLISPLLVIYGTLNFTLWEEKLKVARATAKTTVIEE